MKFVINDQIGARKNYSNLPERDRPTERKARPRLLQDSDDEQHENTFELASSFEAASITDEASGFEASEPTFEQTQSEPEYFKETAEPTEEHAAGSAYEEPERESWKQSRWAPVMFVLALLVLAGVAYVATHSEEDSPLEQIKVEGAHLLTDKEVITLANIDRSQKFYDIDLKQIAARIEKHSLIKAAFPRRETNPSTIVLSIEERRPAAIMRSISGEMLMIDQEGRLLRPKRLEGLRDAAKMLQVPLLAGIDEKDTASYRWMTNFVLHIESLENGALQGSIGELRRTPTGGYMITTLATQTPIFLGSPSDEPFTMSNEREHAGRALPKLSLFEQQLHLLAKAWHNGLQHDIEAHPPLCVDARFAKQIIVKRQDSFRAVKAPKTSQDSTARLIASNADRQTQSVTQSHSPRTTIGIQGHQ